MTVLTWSEKKEEGKCSSLGLLDLEQRQWPHLGPPTAHLSVARTYTDPFVPKDPEAS